MSIMIFFQWLVENKDWMLSGLGISLVAFIYKRFSPNKDKHSYVNTVQVYNTIEPQKKESKKLINFILTCIIILFIGIILGLSISIKFIANENQKDEPFRESPNESIENQFVDISGFWIVENIITESSISKYESSISVWEFQIKQQGTIVDGEGRKLFTIMDGDTTKSKAGTSIEFGNVDINENNIVVEFVEKKENKKFKERYGVFQWIYNDSKQTLEGTFQTDIADSKGSSVAYKIKK